MQFVTHEITKKIHISEFCKNAHIQSIRKFTIY